MVLTAVVALSAAPLMAPVAALADGLPNGPIPYQSSGYNWSGLYFGGHVGGVRNNTDWRYTNPVPPNCCTPFSDGYNSVIAGGQVGLQVQWQNLVLGIEASGSGFPGNKSSSQSGCITGIAGANCFATLGEVFTLGPRLGYASGNFMMYATGGGAFGWVNSRLTTSASPNGFDSTSERHTGWFVGGGLEYGITKTVSLGLEYKHIDLGTQRHVSSADAGPTGVNGRDIGVTSDAVTARLNFRFGPTIEEYRPLK